MMTNRMQEQVEGALLEWANYMEPSGWPDRAHRAWIKGGWAYQGFAPEIRPDNPDGCRCESPVKILDNIVRYCRMCGCAPEIIDALINERTETVLDDGTRAIYWPGVWQYEVEPSQEK